MHVAIIGGGLTGIFAAKKLQHEGHTPFIIEKSKSLGGRMATRRINGGKADHGAQFFTVRSELFQNEVDHWLQKGWAKEWFKEKYPRYTGVEGMNHLLKEVAAGLDAVLEEKIIRIESDGHTVTLASENGELYFADAAIVTSPVPQTLALIEQSALDLSEFVRAQLAAGSFRPCLVGLVELHQPLPMGTSGLKDSDLPAGIDKIAANDQKGISETPILSVYMDSEWSTSFFEQEDEKILDALTETLSPVVSDFHSIQLKRWRFSEAVHVYDRPFLSFDDYPILAAGDSFLHPDDNSGRTRVESAVLSGIAAAEEILKNKN